MRICKGENCNNEIISQCPRKEYCGTQEEKGSCASKHRIQTIEKSEKKKEAFTPEEKLAHEENLQRLRLKREKTAAEKRARIEADRVLYAVPAPRKPLDSNMSGHQMQQMMINKHNRQGCERIYTVRNFVALFAVVTVFYYFELAI